MALDLQLSTQKARDELQKFVASLTTFEQRLAGAGKSGAGLEARLNQLAAFKGIEASAVNSLNNLATGLTRLATSATQINNVSRNLNSLARVRVDAVAANVEKISAALAGLRIPPNLDRFAQTLQRISTAATQAAGGMRQFASAAASVRVPAGLATMSANLTRIGGTSRAAAGGMQMMGGAVATARNALAGFGVVLGAFGFARFIQSAYEAVRVMDRFNNIVTATQGANQVGKEMEFIRQKARELKLPIDALTDSYGKFSAAAISSGESVDQVHKIFESMAVSSRVLKLSTEQMRLAMLGLEQMYSKGNVSMQELRRQWGEQIPGGFAIAARAMNMTQKALTDLVSSGNLKSTDFIPKLADELMKTYGPGLTTALTSAQAAFDNFYNAVFLSTEAFGRGFFDAFKGPLDELGTAMQDPAFLEGAKQWGNILGQALNGVLQVLKLVAQNWDAVKFAIQAVISVAIFSTVLGWVNSLGAAGQAAWQLAGAMRGVAVAAGAMGFIQSILVGLRVAFAAALAPAIALAVAIGPVGWALIAVAIAVGIAIAAYNDWANASALISEANDWITQTTYAMISAIIDFIPLPQFVADGLWMIVDGARVILNFFVPLTKVIEFARMAWEFFHPPVKKAADAIDAAGKMAAAAAAPVKKAGDATKAAGDAARAGAPAYDAFGNRIAGAGNRAEGATGQFLDLAAAARSAAAAAGGGGGGDRWADNRAHNPSGADLPLTGQLNEYGEQMDLRARGFSGGGISHRPTGRAYRLPASAFINAPSFAGGGISDGGIPAVLHPNEAVVPLAGGGTIPVQNMSGGQSSLMLLKPLNLIVDYTKQTKTSVERVWEATVIQTSIMKNAFDRSEALLTHIDNSRLVEIINAINGLKSSMGSSGGGFSGGLVGGGGIGGQGTNIDKVLNLLDAQLASIAQMAASGNNQGHGALTMVAGRIVASGSKAYYEAILPIEQANRDMIEAQYRAGLLSEAQVEEMLSNLSKAGAADGGGFATGSPNASKDANGGFNATLHRDEAVIPLPDGRTVPVTMRSDAMDRISRFLDAGSDRVMTAGSSGGGARAGGVTIQVNMTVNAKDAESFRASRDQIMRDLKTDLDRAARTIGNRSDIDDPTRRV